MNENGNTAGSHEFPSVIGNTIRLSIIHHDSTQQCVEYIVERPLVPLLQSANFFFLAVTVLLLAISIHHLHITGISLTTFVSIFLIYRLFWKIHKETLLVASSIGLQFTATFRYGQQTSSFIPWHSIRNILIIEAFSMQRVLYNLVVLVDSPGEPVKQKLIPLFQNTKPKLRCLECIYQSLNNHLPEIQRTLFKKTDVEQNR